MAELKAESLVMGSIVSFEWSRAADHGAVVYPTGGK